MSAFCQECIDAARETLQEHDRCVAVITKAQGKTVFLEAYINWFVSDDTPFRSVLLAITVNNLTLKMQDSDPVSIYPLYRPILPHHRDIRGLRPSSHEKSC